MRNFEKQPEQAENPNDRFKKYRIEFLKDGSIRGPKRPEQFGKTPEFIFKEDEQVILEAEKTFLSEHFGKAFPTSEHRDEVLTIVDKVFQSVTGKFFKDFSNIIIMTPDDFEEYARITAPKLKEDRGISDDFHGINLGGLIIIRDTGGSNCFPLLFHELGHAMYPNEHENYLDELRAMYFQILCTKKLEKELEKIGIKMSFPDDYYKDFPLPTEDHRKAFDDARVLYMFQTNYDLFVKGKANNEKLQNDLLDKIKQTSRSFK